MRYVRAIVLGALAITLITIALANREPLTLRLIPESLQGLLGLSWQITLPIFVILILAVGAGVLLGFVWEWVREHKHRATAVKERRQRQELEQHIKTSARPARESDEILALVEHR